MKRRHKTPVCKCKLESSTCTINLVFCLLTGGALIHVVLAHQNVPGQPATSSFRGNLLSEE